MPLPNLSQQWTRLRQLLESRPRCVVTTHVRPDGDAIGSVLALARMLRQIGCDASIVTQDPVPRFYRFLDPGGEVRVYQPERDDPILRAANVVFVVDVTGWERLGRPGKLMQTLPATSVCIDHHQTSGSFAQIDVTVAEAPAAGTLLLDLAQHLGCRMTREIAEPLYVAIATDCGWFRFANTDPDALQQCAELARVGLDIPWMYEQIYESYRWERARLLARALASLRSEAEGQIAWFTLTPEDFAQTGGDEQDTEGFVDIVRTIKDAEVVLFFRRTDDGETKVSLRSKHRVDVAKLSEQFGGGGHRRAAGITTSQPLADIIPLVIAAARASLLGKQR